MIVVEVWLSLRLGVIVAGVSCVGGAWFSGWRISAMRFLVELSQLH